MATGRPLVILLARFAAPIHQYSVFPQSAPCTLEQLFAGAGPKAIPAMFPRLPPIPELWGGFARGRFKLATAKMRTANPQAGLEPATYPIVGLLYQLSYWGICAAPGKKRGWENRGGYIGRKRGGEVVCHGLEPCGARCPQTILRRKKRTSPANAKPPIIDRWGRLREKCAAPQIRAPREATYSMCSVYQIDEKNASSFLQKFQEIVFGYLHVFVPLVTY